MCGRLISLNLVLPRGLSARRDFPTHARGGKWPFAFGRQVATCRSEGRGPRSEFEAPRPSRLSLFVVIRHGSTTCLGHGSTPSTVGEFGEVKGRGKSPSFSFSFYFKRVRNGATPVLK